jgi:alpha-beta hydrolase superfamily lysophospholipase
LPILAQKLSRIGDWGGSNLDANSLQSGSVLDAIQQLDFQQQVDLVVSDLQSNFWQEDARVIANSFGAYLFLHAQAQMEPYIGKVILLSPIVGEFSNEETRMNFIPPRAEKLLQLATANSFPIPKQCEVHVGSEDWQSNPANVTAFGSMLGINVTVVPNAGHMLPKEYVGNLLDKWLN